MALEYVAGAERPDLAVTWTNSNGAVIDFSTGWAFTLKIGNPGQAALLTKTAGITGAATAPNINIAWDASELDAVTKGAYVLQLFARNASKDRVLQESFHIVPAVA